MFLIFGINGASIQKGERLAAWRGRPLSPFVASRRPKHWVTPNETQMMMTLWRSVYVFWVDMFFCSLVSGPERVVFYN